MSSVQCSYLVKLLEFAQCHRHCQTEGILSFTMSKVPHKVQVRPVSSSLNN